MKIWSVFTGIAILGMSGTAGIVLTSPQPQVVVEAPVLSLNSSDLSKVSELLSKHPQDAVALSELYLALADVIERDNSVIKTLGQIRESNSRSGRLLFQRTGMHGKHDCLAEAVDSFLESKLGATDVLLTEELRQTAVESFRELSQACTFGMR